MQFCSSPATAVKRSLPVVATSSSNGRRSRTLFRRDRRSNKREEEKRRRALRILRAFWNNNDDGVKKGNAEEEAEKIARALYGKEEEEEENNEEDDEEAERLYYQSLPRELNDGFETSWDVSDAPRDSLVVELGKLVKQKWEEEAAKQQQIIGDDDDDSYSEFPTAPELKSVFAFPEGRDDGNDGRNGNSWIRIENVCLRSKRTFRKMHLELAWGPMDFVVLHCVIYPHASVDAPIFAGDVVGFRGRMSLSIVDLAPTTTTKKGGGEEEEDIFDKFVSGLESRKRIEETLEQRPLPEWGEAILSPKCVCIGGDKDESENRKQFEMFRDYFLDVMDGYLFLASAASDRKILEDAVRAYKTNEKVLSSSREEEEEEDIVQKEDPEEEDHPSFALSDAILRLKNQTFFCEKQLANEKTRSVLRRAMGDDLTERYMTEVLFDVDENTPLS
jgi:hypothetical protein